jgi:glucose-1-phosphate cytidylyltransferase
MIKIGKYPILVHIIKHFNKFGYKDFLIAAGYKGEVIKNFFKKKKNLFKNLDIKVIDTGQKTMTGGRIKRLKKYLNDDDFFLTYGDGLSDVNINKLYNFYKKSKKKIVLTAVRPPARFGHIKLKDSKAVQFKEKSKLDEGWINGGFFVMSKIIFKYLKNDQTYLEREPLEVIAKKSLLGAYRHYNFWQCVDTKRDKENLENLLKKRKIKF